MRLKFKRLCICSYGTLKKMKAKQKEKLEKERYENSI